MSTPREDKNMYSITDRVYKGNTTFWEILTQMGKHEIKDNYETNEFSRFNTLFMRATATAQRPITKSVQRN